MYAPAVLQSIQHMILHIFAECMEKLVLFLIDIVEAYTKTKEDLKRVVYLLAPHEMGFPSNVLL